MFLAQIQNVSPGAWYEATKIAAFVIMIAGIAGGLVLGILNRRDSRASKPREIMPQPLGVSIDDPPMTRGACKKEQERISEAMGAMVEKIDAVATRMDTNEESGRQRRQDIYNEMKKDREHALSMVTSLGTEQDRKLEEIFKVIRDMASKIAAQGQAVEDLRARQQSLDGDIKAMPDRVVALLRNTGVIK